MNLQSALGILGVGTSEGAVKGWDTRGRGRKVIDPPVKDIPAGQSTEDAWKDKATGKYAPEREAWHQSFADNEIAGKVAPVGRKPLALLMGGGTASGKSTIARKIEGNNPNSVHVDSDEYKPQIPEHAQLMKENPDTATERVHEESSDLAKLILAKAVANNLDIVYDATSAGTSLAKVVTSLKDKGYEVHGVFADVPEDMAVQRADARANDPNDSSFGRHVPLSAIHATHVGAAANFMVYRSSPLFDTISLYDTTGKIPSLVYNREGRNQGQVYDDAFWKYYQKKAASS